LCRPQCTAFPYTTLFRSGLDLEYAGHNRVSGEMPLEKPFVEGYILNSHNVGITHLDDLVDEREGIAMRQLCLDVLLVMYWGLSRVVHGSALVVPVLPDVLFELAGKLHIRTMARPACDNVRLNRIAHQCKVAHDVEELMPCRFVGKAEFEVVEVSLA